jgi:hypothetical protein
VHQEKLYIIILNSKGKSNNVQKPLWDFLIFDELTKILCTMGLRDPKLPNTVETSKSPGALFYMFGYIDDRFLHQISEN